MAQYVIEARMHEEAQLVQRSEVAVTTVDETEWLWTQ